MTAITIALASRARARSLAINIALYVLAILGALAIASLLIVVATDASPYHVFKAMFEGSLSRPSAIGLTLDEATPLLIVALGVTISERAGVTNLGAEGQLMMGAIFGAFAAFRIGGPPIFSIPLILGFSILGGALWSGIAALLRFWRGANIVICTLLLNFIAMQVIEYAVLKPWFLQETTLNTQKAAQSDRLAASHQLPRLGEYPGFNVSSAVFFAIALVAFVTFALYRTRWGFQLKVLGLNPSAARASGIRMGLLGGGALMLSGAFAGFAGGAMFTGTAFRVQPGFSDQVGFNGLLVALIARRNPMAVVPVAFFMGALRAGGGFLAATGVPRYLVEVVQALLVLASLLPPIALQLMERRRAIQTARREVSRQDVSLPTLVGAPA